MKQIIHNPNCPAGLDRLIYDITTIRKTGKLPGHTGPHGSKPTERWMKYAKCVLDPVFLYMDLSLQSPALDATVKE